VHVRAFADSNNDGIGDFAGLTRASSTTSRIWASTPSGCCPSIRRRRDDGYDIADYRNIHPQYGTRADFRPSCEEAHRRGLRVITELVINHTSDQHPWFQAARRAPAGSAKRNFYVWSDSARALRRHAHHLHRHRKSNWTFDRSPRATTGTASSATSRI
jgi:maltose alpha-D-glucosyltransferase/alpha-amylase